MKTLGFSVDWVLQLIKKKYYFYDFVAYSLID